WVLSLSPLDIIAQRLPPEVHLSGIRSLVGVGRPLWPPRPSSRSTPCRHTLLAETPRGSTSMDFGENQLSPGLIGLSPLPTSHPNGFQPIPVRASTGCYPSFTLLMGRSPWLRVYARQLQTPSLQDSLSLWLRPSRPYPPCRA